MHAATGNGCNRVYCSLFIITPPFRIINTSVVITIQLYWLLHLYRNDTVVSVMSRECLIQLWSTHTEHYSQVNRTSHLLLAQIFHTQKFHQGLAP